MTDHEDCHRFFALLSELLDGELDQVTAEDIECHIADCPECVACWATFRKSVEVYRGLEEETAPPDLLPRLKEVLKGHSPKKTASRRFEPKPCGSGS
jgi:anti-sigma factor RsiW